MEVYLCTRNRWKIEIARRAIEEKYGILVKPTDVKVSELQHDDPEVIAKVSAKEAYHLLGGPVIKCDSGLRISALGGFPGPYSNYVERTLGVDGLLQVCDTLEDRSASIYSVVAFCDERLSPVSFYGETPGTVVKERRGGNGYFFDFIFVPQGFRRTLAEFDDTKRWEFWKEPYEQFAEWHAAQKR